MTPPDRGPEGSRQGRAPRPWLAWLPPVLFFLGVALLGFLSGSWVAWRDTRLFRRALRPAFVGVQALREGLRPAAAARRVELPGTPWSESLRGGARAVGAGAAPGLTLLVIGQGAHLVELDGRVRHSWHRDYDTLPAGPGRRESLPQRVLWFRARALPGGDLLALYDTKRTSPQGLALARLDRDSNPRWVHYGPVHHDFDVASDGRIYVLAQSVRERPPAGLEELVGPVLDEHVRILSPDGTLLREMSLLDALAASAYKPLVNRVGGPLRDRKPYRTGDYLHSNNVEILEAPAASRLGLAGEDLLLVSMRNLGVVAVLDAKREAIVWARRGEWFMQHDPDLLESGNLLIYDNQGDWDREGRTRVIEVDPASGAILWQYPGRTGRRLQNRVRGDQQRLGNGNTLISDQDGHRVIEVDPAGRLVWEFAGALALPEGRKLPCMIYYAERYAPGTLEFGMNEGRLPTRYLGKEEEE